MKQPRLKALLARNVIVRQNHRYAIKHNKQATMAFDERDDFFAVCSVEPKPMDQFNKFNFDELEAFPVQAAGAVPVEQAIPPPLEPPAPPAHPPPPPLLPAPPAPHRCKHASMCKFVSRTGTALSFCPGQIKIGCRTLSTVFSMMIREPGFLMTKASHSLPSSSRSADT